VVQPVQPGTLLLLPPPERTELCHRNPQPVGGSRFDNPGHVQPPSWLTGMGRRLWRDWNRIRKRRMLCALEGRPFFDVNDKDDSAMHADLISEDSESESGSISDSSCE
jgi:hypothetical protein